MPPSMVAVLWGAVNGCDADVFGGRGVHQRDERALFRRAADRVRFLGRRQTPLPAYARTMQSPVLT
eukprot:963922-Rhodomonas_salina.2